MVNVHREKRRALLYSLAGAGIGLAIPSLVTAASATRGIEGLNYQDWFKESTFDLRKDLELAETAGKVLMLIWEQVGCVYCQKMHRITFQQPNIVKLIESNFHVVQMDLRGDRTFINFEGKKEDESKIASGFFIRTTPTTQFLDDVGNEVFRIPGYAEPALFELAYRYVVEQGYERTSFKDWVKSRQP